jgi:L-alanine-DL-glutamate epimerase-like enolase superfamily enzyme
MLVVGCFSLDYRAMGKATDIRTVGAGLYFLPVQTRVPLKFGTETLAQVICARARVAVADSSGRRGEGWGETPLSVQWVWPGNVSLEERSEALRAFSVQLAELWASITTRGHPIEIGHDFQETVLPGMLNGFNRRRRPGQEPMPWLAALLCCSAFDLALHDAYGKLHGRPIYETYGPEFVNRDLASFLQPASGARVSFKGKFPAAFLSPQPASRLVAWHLVGGLDALDKTELTGAEPNDGYPVTLEEWIERDGLKCLKVKLCGDDAGWDFQRLVKVGEIGVARGTRWLSADFNCTVREPEYVNAILDRLRDEQPRIYGMVLYVEQPFPYELELHPIDVRSVAARKPLFLDESAHDWKMVRLGRELGWSGVALKTCKTQTGAVLSACWAKAHGMSLMVQDLTNPMLAQIPHVLLAAHVGTIMGVETNAMQFYPEASRPEAQVHPGLYQRRDGQVDLASIRGPGFGYRLEEIHRALPEPAAMFEE